MSFFGEMAQVLGYDEAKAALGYSYINYGGEAVYIEGVRAVLQIDEKQMAFRLRKGVLYVEGEDLRADELTGGTATVRGKIVGVYTVAPHGERKL